MDANASQSLRQSENIDKSLWSGKSKKEGVWGGMVRCWQLGRRKSGPCGSLV